MSDPDPQPVRRPPVFGTTPIGLVVTSGSQKGRIVSVGYREPNDPESFQGLSGHFLLVLDSEGDFAEWDALDCRVDPEDWS
jgi:hypothetical protein